jgi:glycine C-acetyltransferase
MTTDFISHLTTELQAIKDAGLFKNERIIVSPQGADIKVNSGAEGH